MNLRTRTLCLTVLVSTTALALASDWPQWHGPNRDNRSTETGLLKEWPAGGPRLLWSANSLGGGYSTPSLARGRIYGMGYREADEVVWALDARDGNEVWSTPTRPAYREMGYAEGPRCTPTVDGEHLYILGGAGNLACLETAGGRLVWQVDLVKDHGGRMMSGWGYSESPLVDGDRVVVTPGGPQGTMAAFDKRTGKRLWQTADLTDNAAYSSIVIGTLAGERQYVQLTDAHVFGVAPADGRVLWRAPRGGKTAVIPTPVVHDDHVYVTSGYGVGCNLFHITRDGDAFAAKEVYANREMVNHHGSVVLIGEHVYGHSDARGWICQEFRTGKTVWAERRQLGKGALTYADGHLILRAEAGNGTVVLIAATPEGFIEKGRFEQPERSNKNSWPHPVVCDGRLYLRDQDVLLCYDLKP
ncbi:MAG: PQQ-like beta-propeller repeat protein [Verrucomicrobia bacterium]|nr:PQQ-like beta-propeller repeat protein [Verrucomicrobiota bacterium]